MNRKRNSFSRIEDAARRYIWHPFTQMKEWEGSDPLIIEKGRSIYLYDIYGNRYLDGVSSIWVNIHGHRKKEIDKAIISQLKDISHSILLGLTNIPAIKYLSMMLEPLNDLPQVGEIRQKGMMVGIELVEDKESKTPYPLEERIWMKVANEARHRGMIIRPIGDIIVLIIYNNKIKGGIDESVSIFKK